MQSPDDAAEKMLVGLFDNLPSHQSPPYCPLNMSSFTFGNENTGVQVGISHGPIHLYRPETPPPPPLSTVPFRRDPDFVNRGALLDQVHEKGSVPGSRIALVGLGGVGYRVRDESPNIWVFWIHASSSTRFEQSLRDIIDRIKIPGRQDPKANIFKLFHDWLYDQRKGEWMLVFDNLDDDQFLHDALPATHDGLGNDQSCTRKRSIWSYFPQSLNGSIIITSRSRHVVSSMVEDSDIIIVEPMDQPHATALFEKKLPQIQVPGEKIIQLSAALEFMPLAIVQAAAYIKNRAPRFSVSQYLESFLKSDRKKITLLGYEGGHLRRDREAKNAILLTWQISFDHIRQIRPSAAELLSLMSFFDRQGIPDSLLREDKNMEDNIRYLSLRAPHDTNDDNESEESSSESNESDNFEDDILLLRDYSLISISTDEANFEMHRLVQLATQEWLKTHSQLELWKERFIKTLYRNFPRGEFENWTRCQLLFAHVQCAVAQKPATESSLGEWGSLLHEAASFAWARGNFDDGKRMAEKAIKVRKELFGPENEKTLDSTEILGLVYSLGGQWKKAEELEVLVMEISKRVRGSNHPSTLTSMSHLASTYWQLGRWKEAEELEIQVMATRKQVLGPDHPSTLKSIGNLASIYSDQGRWKDAEVLELQVMQARKRILGPDHPETLESIGNLASTYSDQGQLQDAEELEIQVVESRKRVLGPEHPDTLAGMGNLAWTYWHQGRWDAAEELGIEVMEIRQRVLGPDHPSTLTSMGNLAWTYRHQERWKEAERLEIRVMETRQQLLGPTHPSTLTSMSNLASTYRSQKRWKEAEMLEIQVMESRKELLGPNHPSTLTSISNLASTYRHQDRFKDAEELEIQVMETSKQVLGPNHPNTLNLMANLAHTWKSSGKHDDAVLLLTECAQLRNQKLGPSHPDTISATSTLTKWRGVDDL